MESLPPGNPIKPEWFRNPANLGYWRSSPQASWNVNIRKSGTFRGTLTYATPNDDTLLVLYIDGKPLFSSWLKGTGDWHKYQEVDMSLLGIPAGEHKVDVKWESATPEGAGNFGSILLKKE